MHNMCVNVNFNCTNEINVIKKIWSLDDDPGGVSDIVADGPVHENVEKNKEVSSGRWKV